MRPAFAIAVTLLLLPAVIPSTTAAVDLLLPWGSTWSYCTSEHDASCDPLTRGRAPFGENEGHHCGFSAFETPWPLGTALTATTVFVVPPGVDRVWVEYVIDNDVQVTFQGAISGGFSDARGDCDLYSAVPFNAMPGPVLVTVHAQDHGILAAFDMSVTR